MDPRDNPFTPNAGAQPPLLVGRQDLVTGFDILLARLERGYVERSMIITGLRGVGKTVLLGTFEQRARDRSWVTIEAEITKDTPFGPRIAVLVRRALFEIAPRAHWTDRMKRLARVLKSFSLTVSPEGAITAGLDVEPLEGSADSGDLVHDLTELMVALGEAARERGSGVALLFDEVQFLAAGELTAVIVALHKTVQRALPITLVGAGLPQIPRLAGEAKSYAERLFTFPDIGPLPADDARRALVEPARAGGLAFDAQAADRVVAITQGYPFFVQEYGRTLWNQVPGPIVRPVDVEAVVSIVEGDLDSGFFKVRADRTTALELRYLRAMAELGPGPYRTADIAVTLGRSVEQLGPIRSRLIDKGLIYTPSYGIAAFTVPHFDRYLVRTRPLEPGPQE